MPSGQTASTVSQEMFVSDLRDFLDLPDDVPGPARRMAERLAMIVRASTAGDAGTEWVSALTCDRRPGRRPCPGQLAVARTDVPPSIAWYCTSCGDEGVITDGMILSAVQAFFDSTTSEDD